MPSRDFFERNEAELRSPINTVLRPLSKSPVSFFTIPRSRHDPKVLGRDDAEVVGDRIAEVRPIARNLFAQENERRVGELRTSCVAFVVRNVSMHQAP